MARGSRLNTDGHWVRAGKDYRLWSPSCLLKTWQTCSSPEHMWAEKRTTVITEALSWRLPSKDMTDSHERWGRERAKSKTVEIRGPKFIKCGAGRKILESWNTKTMTRMSVYLNTHLPRVRLVFLDSQNRTTYDDHRHNAAQIGKQVYRRKSVEGVGVEVGSCRGDQHHECVHCVDNAKCYCEPFSTHIRTRNQNIWDNERAQQLLLYQKRRNTKMMIG